MTPQSPDSVEDPEVIELDLSNPAHGGATIGRVDGQVVFVSGGLPGETVRAHLDRQRSSKSKRGFRTGRASEILTSSAHRVLPQCRAAALGGGCCDLDFVDATGSAEFKTAVVIDQLRRIGRIEVDAGSIQTVSLAPATGWRTRARLGVDRDGRAGVFKRNSRDIVPLADASCAQWAPGLVDGLSNRRFTPGAQVAVAIGDQGDQARSAENLPVHSVVELTGSRHRPRRKVVAGAPAVPHTVPSSAGLTWQIPADGFWQSHGAAPEFYARWIRDHIPAGRSTAWDLYGGAGVFAAAVADRVDAVDCVDTDTANSQAGREAIAKAGLRNVRFVAGDVGRTIGSLRTQGGVHVAIVDPPRTGAGERVVRSIAEAEPRHVVHIGCDPATAARDLSAWIDCGYRMSKLTVVDAFPLTHHVEVLVHLTATHQSDEPGGAKGTDVASVEN